MRKKCSFSKPEKKRWKHQWPRGAILYLLLLSYIASLRQRQFSRPESRVSEFSLRAELVNSVINWEQSPTAKVTPWSAVVKGWMKGFWPSWSGLHGWKKAPWRVPQWLVCRWWPRLGQFRHKKCLTSLPLPASHLPVTPVTLNLPVTFCPWRIWI